MHALRFEHSRPRIRCPSRSPRTHSVCHVCPANGSAESETDSEFETESARIEARALRLQSIGKTNKIKEENAASVAALVAKRPPFYAALQKVIASARGYNQWPAVVLTKVCTRRALKGLSNCKVTSLLSSAKLSSSLPFSLSTSQAICAQNPAACIPASLMTLSCSGVRVV